MNPVAGKGGKMKEQRGRSDHFFRPMQATIFYKN